LASAHGKAANSLGLIPAQPDAKSPLFDRTVKLTGKNTGIFEQKGSAFQQSSWMQQHTFLQKGKNRD
jgi:hypothetical protein